MDAFRTFSPIADDLDTTIVRIEKNQMQKLGISEGDTVKVTGAKSAGALCHSIDDGFKMSQDSDIVYASSDTDILPQLRASNFVAGNITKHGSAGMVPVTLEKIHDGVKAANKVLLMSLDSGSKINAFDKSKLNRVIVCKNNKFYFRNSEPQKNFAFLVTGVEPSDYCQINKDTTVEVVPIKTDVIHTSFDGVGLEKIQEVIPITYQNTLHNVTVTVPSLEIFDTGFRFYVYAKGEFDENSLIPNGHVSIIVTMHDDADSGYELYHKGGGGSQSPTGFDHRHEFRGPAIGTDASQLTIMLKEIIIQAQFPRLGKNPRMGRMIARGTKEEYEKIEKFPSFFIISGPWKVTFPLKQ